MWNHRVASYREFIWTKKFCTQLFVMKFHHGGNECKQSQSWKFGFCPLSLRNSPLYTYGWSNHSTSNARLWLVCPSVYRGEFLKVNRQQPNFQEWLWLHSLSPLYNIIPNFCTLWFPWNELSRTVAFLVKNIWEIDVC